MGERSPDGLGALFYVGRCEGINARSYARWSMGMCSVEEKKKAPGGERVPGGTEDYELHFREPKDCTLTLCNRSAESREIKSV